jgi:ATPase family associated with various cellular activities (AAA)
MWPPQECFDLFGSAVTTRVSPHDQIRGTAIDPSAVTKDELLACFSFKDELWRIWPLSGSTSDPRHSGPPGVGKTLTAEAVAEKLRRPLYSVCGTLRHAFED